ncbi:diguanylate cyclase domain-containing protein [uncultured Jatrophihabitans sp.]|uniref:GGDEF domain-containing protein n=1 Tax=uncultured Jatrophihabitans sp. TaxID=1610747 RepID=UPI0035CA15EC
MSSPVAFLREYGVADDAARVAALRALAVLDRPRRAELDSLARLAAHICGTARSLINLIDEDRAWSAAAHGCEPVSVHRSDSMCAVAIRSADVAYTPDAAEDPRWSGSPGVDGRLDRVRVYAAAPLTLPSGHVIGTVCVFDTVERVLSADQLDRLRDIAGQAVLLLTLQREIDQLGAAATRDFLTGAANHAMFESAAQQALARHERGLPAPTVFFLDLDRFKAVNDEYGHAVGDALLVSVAKRVAGVLRNTDMLARLSGDEFVVLTDGAGDAGVQVLAQRIRRQFTMPFEVGGHTLSVRASLGWATARWAETLPELLHRADEAMYGDKRQHRAAAS